MFEEWTLNLYEFLEKGGPVLTVLFWVAFILWALILERLIYFLVFHSGEKRRAVAEWAKVEDKHSWHGEQIRNAIASKVAASANANLVLIKTLVALAPLLGLLGTVTGMIAVFDVLGFTGAANIQAMSGGVSRATIPTMAGLSLAIVGILFSSQLER